jgi:membrane-bound lytic murein transglycosylase D
MKFNKYLYIFLSLIICIQLYAKENETTQLTFEDLLDEQHRSFLKNNQICSSFIKLDNINYITENNISRTFQMHNSIIPFVYNDRIKSIIELYLLKYPAFTCTVFQKSQNELKEFEKAFEKYHMPPELKLLPIALSANNPFFDYFPDKKGSWQLNYFIAKLNGAIIDSLQDERLEPAISAYVSANYVFRLYNELKDIRSAVYAFSNGINPVKRALKNSGGSSIRLYEELNTPHRDILNVLSALYFIDVNFEKFFHKQEISEEIKTDTLSAEKQLFFKSISKYTVLDSNSIKMLNPKYYRQIIPKNSNFILPENIAYQFIDKKDSIYSFNDSIIKIEPVIKKSKTVKKQIDRNLTEVYYKVKSGDTPGFIAEWFDVGLSDLRRWNNIRGNLIRAGQTLLIYVPANKADYYSQYNHLSYSEKQRREGYNVKPKNMKTEKLADGEYFIYVVQKGDNPWSIAQKFPGVSDKDILKWNSINPKDLRPGQKLKIKKL